MRPLVTMADATHKDEPAVLALEAYQARNYKKCSSLLSELESVVGPNKTVALNKSLAEFSLSNLSNLEPYRKCLCRQLGQNWPNVNTTELKTHSDVIPFYNYAIILYHKKYYSQANIILEKLFFLLKNDLADPSMFRRVVLFLFEISLCRRLPEKVVLIAEQAVNEFLTTNNQLDMFNRLVFRANLMLKKQMQPLNSVSSVEWLFLKAHQQHVMGDWKGALFTLSQYNKYSESKNRNGKLDEIWGALNNNIGIIQLSMRKCHLSVKYIQHAIKEHYRTLNPLQDNKLLVSPDRPIYVYNLGIALLYADRPEDGFECLVEAARHFPNNPRLWVRLAECCINNFTKKNNQNLIVKKIGSGLHTKLLVGKATQEKYLVSGESFAIPTLSLEFAALCLRNALILLPTYDIPKDTETSLFQVPPCAPVKWNHLKYLRSSAFLLNSFIMLRLSDPVAALKSSTSLLNQPDECLSASYKALAHIYTAEASIALDRLPEAIDHLNPTMIHEMAAHLRAGIHDSVGMAIWLNGAVCQILRGDFATAKNILLQLNSAHALQLQLYIEICAGNVDNCHSLIRKLKLYPS